MRTLLFLAQAGTMAPAACTGSQQSGDTAPTTSTATHPLAPDKETAAPFFELARQSGEWAIVQKVGEQDFYFVDFAPGSKEASRETLMHWDGMKFVAQPQQMKQ